MANKSEYVYCFQSIAFTDKLTEKEEVRNFIRVTKSRAGGNSGNTYMLDFDENEKKYKKDKPISFKLFALYFKERHRLG